jgi:PAS domain S-box-containing protein
LLDHGHPELHDAEYVVFADSARRYTDASDGACRLVGYSREEFLRLSIEDVSFHDDEVSRLFSEYLKRGEQQGEYVLRHKSGTPVPIRYRALLFPDGCSAAIWEPIKDWRELYLAALVEVDSKKLKSKLDAALQAVQQRTRELTAISSAPNSELQALRDASSALQTLLRTA